MHLPTAIVNTLLGKFIEPVMMKKLGRNDPCACGSGKKYKQCCLPPAPDKSPETASISGSFHAVLEHHRAGRLSQAKTLCQQILRAAPNHADALHFLGVIAHQEENNELAVELIGKAIRINPSSLMHYNLGLALKAQGNLDAAAESYRTALSNQPDYAEAHYNLGNIFQEQGWLDMAAACYHNAITCKPGYAKAHCNLAIALQAQGKLDEAAASYRHTISHQPDYAEAHYNLGIMLKEQGKIDAAVASYQKAILHEPGWADAHHNLAIALQAQGKLDEAAASYRHAISHQPDYAEAHYNLGIMLKEQGKIDAAVASYQKAILHEPGWADAHCNLAIALQAQGKLDEATASYRRVLELDPGNESAGHLIASLTAGTTERAPSQYVEKLFDGYADKFDTHLTQNLEYKTPIELLGLIKQVTELPAREWDVLDLGCGTGLAGMEISSHARQLAGVDLSAKMLAKAHARNVYHRLVHSDLLPMMRGEKASNYDVIIAADVFVYLGMLDEIVSEARRLLRAGGFFMFSVEALEALPEQIGGIEDHAGYRLSPSGRYAHSSTYLEKLASSNGFASLSLVFTQVRLEEGKPVMAWLVLWENPGNSIEKRKG